MSESETKNPLFWCEADHHSATASSGGFLGRPATRSTAKASTLPPMKRCGHVARYRLRLRWVSLSVGTTLICLFLSSHGSINSQLIAPLGKLPPFSRRFHDQLRGYRTRISQSRDEKERKLISDPVISL